VVLCSRDDNMLTVIEFILVGGGANHAARAPPATGCINSRSSVPSHSRAAVP
jgi:hypothetical protein